MELLLTKGQKKIVSVFINVSGKIIYSDSVNAVLNNNIFDVVDKNEILKLSMYENRTLQIESTLKGYKCCAATVIGKGIGKYIWLCFIADYIYNDSIKSGKNINEMMKSYFSNSSRLKSVDMDLFVSKTVKTMSKEGIDIEKGKCISSQCIVDLKIIKIMIIVATSVLNYISCGNTITLDCDITEYGARIKMWAKAESMETVRGVVDFCGNYPSLSANIIYINTIASREGIELDLSLANGICQISFVYPLGETSEFDVLAKDMYDEDESIKYIIDTFFISK